MFERTFDVLYRMDQLIHAAAFGATILPAACMPSRRYPIRAWTDEETDLDPPLAAECGHLVELVVGEQHHAAPLANPMDRHPEFSAAE